MGYAEKNLGQGEEVLARVQHTWTGLIGSVFSNVIVVVCVSLFFYAVTTWIPPLLLGLTDASLGDSMGELQKMYDICMIVRNVSIAITILTACIRVICVGISIHCNELIVTNKRLFGRTGIISRNIIDIVLLKLDTINSKNGILGAIFHYGTLEVVSAGSQKVVGGRSVNMTFPYVKNTEEFRRAVLAAIDTAREAERQAQAEAQVAALRQAQEIH